MPYSFVYTTNLGIKNTNKKNGWQQKAKKIGLKKTERNCELKESDRMIGTIIKRAANEVFNVWFRNLLLNNKLVIPARVSFITLLLNLSA